MKAIVKIDFGDDVDNSYIHPEDVINNIRWDIAYSLDLEDEAVQVISIEHSEREE